MSGRLASVYRPGTPQLLVLPQEFQRLCQRQAARAKTYNQELMISHVREKYSQEMMMLTLTLLLPATMDEIFHVKESTSHK